MSGDPGRRPEPRLLYLRQIVETVRLDAQQRHQARKEGRVLGPVTGFASLDAQIGEILHPGIYIVHGSPGVGKSALALQIAASCGCPAVYVTCEMMPGALLLRMAARICDVHLSRLEGGYLHPEIVVSHVQRAAETAPRLGIADATEAAAPVGWIEQATKAVRAAHPHCLIVIDSLHAWAQSAYGDMIEYEALNQALAEVKQMTARLACPALIICERNRSGMREGGMSAAAGTRKIEYSAEGLWELNSDYSRPDKDGVYTVDLVISKNRHGQQGRKVRLTWRGSRQEFRDAEYEAPDGDACGHAARRLG